MDLKAFLRGERVELEGRGLAGLVERPPQKPLIAAVEGFALAGGCEIALACDLIVASETAQFGLPETKRGLIAGSGGLLRLPQRIPRQIAMEYALTGRTMSAEAASHWGLVNRLTPAGAALDGARALANEISANAPFAVGHEQENHRRGGELADVRDLVASKGDPRTRDRLRRCSRGSAWPSPKSGRRDGA